MMFLSLTVLCCAVLCLCLCAGLDSFAALSVMGHLQTLALTMQQTIIATIHQPRSAIWEMFNKVRGFLSKVLPTACG